MQEIKDMIEEAERTDTEGGNEADDFDDGWGEVLGGTGAKLEPHEVEVAKKVGLYISKSARTDTLVSPC